MSTHIVCLISHNNNMNQWLDHSTEDYAYFLSIENTLLLAKCIGRAIWVFTDPRSANNSWVNWQMLGEQLASRRSHAPAQSLCSPASYGVPAAWKFKHQYFLPLSLLHLQHRILWWTSPRLPLDTSRHNANTSKESCCFEDVSPTCLCCLKFSIWNFAALLRINCTVKVAWLFLELR